MVIVEEKADGCRKERQPYFYPIEGGYKLETKKDAAACQVKAD